MGTRTPADRDHAVDALRAGMMFAVVVLHSALVFSAVPAGRTMFRFADPDRGPEFFWLAVGLQAVSMPAFFLTAGYFVASLVGRLGPLAMVTHRLRRITLPFLAFWPVLFALTASGVLFGSCVAGEVTVPSPDDGGAILRHVGLAVAEGAPLEAALNLRWPHPHDRLERVGTLDGTANGAPVWRLSGVRTERGSAAWAALRFLPVGIGAVLRPSSHHLIHLWFLWVLTLLVAAAGVLAPLARRLPTAGVGRRLGSFAFPLAGALPFAAVLWWHRYPIIPTPTTLLVHPATLIGYGLFFAVGALCWRHRDQLSRVGRHWAGHLGLGLTAAVASPSVMTSTANDDGAVPDAWRLVACLCAAVAHWELVWASLGIVVRYADRPVGWVRSLSDASYWVYLVHLPVVLWVAAALLMWPASRFVKFPIVLAVGVGLPLLSYRLFVRRTWIGQFLNGRRADKSVSLGNDAVCGDYRSVTKAPNLPGLPGRIH